jgi:hypothetical protein
MDKRLLSDYIDACELIRETEQQIRRLQAKQSETTQDSVRGSNPEFPYNAQHFKITRITAFIRIYAWIQRMGFLQGAAHAGVIFA